MTFILSRERDEDVVAAFQRYEENLVGHRNAFPQNAYRLATAKWYFNPEDHRCPHDGRLEDVMLSETATGLRHEVRELKMRIRLLGAYHDGHIELYYPRVFRYRFELDSAVHGHRDWLYDEFRLAENGNVLHEIEWSGSGASGQWIIEASDVEFAWEPYQSGRAPRQGTPTPPLEPTAEKRGGSAAIRWADPNVPGNET